MSPERVRMHLHTVWGQQACQRPADWPDAFGRSMSDAPATKGSSSENKGRGNLRALFNEAVAALVAAFGAETPPDDSVNSIYLAFPRLDLAHRARLAKLLMEERTHAVEA